MAVIKTIKLLFPINTGIEWFDTGAIVAPGQTLRVRATGQATPYQPNQTITSNCGNRVNADGVCYPEGSYNQLDPINLDGDGNPCVLEYDIETDIYEPDNVRQDYPDTGNDFVTYEQPCYSLVGKLSPDGATPVLADGHLSFTGTLRLTRDITYVPEQIPLGGKFFIWFNDRLFSDNRGSFDVTIDIIADDDAIPVDVGQPSPFRDVPPNLLVMKQSQVHTTAFCWYVKPLFGDAEAYTSWDQPLDCPEYINEFGLTGNEVPALTYQSFHGIDLTSIPVSVKLDTRAPDVSVIRFDRQKLLSHFYDGAYVEVFEVNAEGDRSERILYFIGFLSNTHAQDELATIEITPYNELLNNPIGARVTMACDVGRLPGETFGRGRCRNQVLNDGQDIDALTFGGKLIGYNSAYQIVLAPQIVNGKAAFLSTIHANHGRLIGYSGANANIPLKIGTFVGETGLVTLRQALPNPSAINDLFLIESGCDKSTTDCLFWNNLPNMRAFPYVPGRDGAVRRFSRQ